VSVQTDDSARCKKCNNWKPASHFATWAVESGHVPTSDHVRRTPLARWREKVVTQETGCWAWIGAATPLGYGTFWIDTKYVPAYRAGYELLVGPIPDGLELDHLCKNPNCVRPDHLEPVTHRENVRRSDAGRQLALRQTTKTSCPQGHPYDAENTCISTSGWRRCRACARAYYHRTKGVKS
jgi:hypothetical protein